MARKKKGATEGDRLSSAGTETPGSASLKVAPSSVCAIENQRVVHAASTILSLMRGQCACTGPRVFTIIETDGAARVEHQCHEMQPEGENDEANGGQGASSIEVDSEGREEVIEESAHEEDPS